VLVGAGTSPLRSLAGAASGATLMLCGLRSPSLLLPSGVLLGERCAALEHLGRMLEHPRRASRGLLRALGCSCGVS